MGSHYLVFCVLNILLTHRLFTVKSLEGEFAVIGNIDVVQNSTMASVTFCDRAYENSP